MRTVEVIIGALLGIMAGTTGTQNQPGPATIVPDKPMSYIMEQEPIAELAPLTKHIVTSVENEAWFGTDRKLKDYEWEYMGQTIMAEARGESFEVQYYVACVILNRVDSELFPNTITGVIYQSEPVIQFCGAYDTQKYEVSDSVWEAIQAALIHNDLPDDVYYFTSEGYLPNTEPYIQVGNMWFSRQGK